jgi:hypothetical protein
MIKITEELYHQLNEDSGGFCLACKQEAYGIEPDAREYKCDSCGEHKVYGAEELLMMGEIEFVDEDEEDSEED